MDNYCQGCGKRLVKVMFFGEKIYTFEEGIYCEKCAKIVVEKRREDIKQNGIK